MDRRDFLKMAGVAGAAVLLPSSLADAVIGGTQNQQLRLVEIYERGTWKKGSWAGLKKDMIFRLRELDGTLVDEHDDTEVCIAVSDAETRPAPEFYSVEGDPLTCIELGHRHSSRVRVWKDGQQVPFVVSVNLRNHTMLRLRSVSRAHNFEPFDYIDLLPVFPVATHASICLTRAFTSA